jgi:hypothetical protein
MVFSPSSPLPLSLKSLRSPLLTFAVKQLTLNSRAAFPGEQQDMKSMVKSWQRAQLRMKLYDVKEK